MCYTRSMSRVSSLLSPLLVSVAIAQPALAAALARLDTATFDARRSVVIVPYQGNAPKATFYRLSPDHFYYEIEPARLIHGTVQYQAVGGAIERFTLADRPTPNVVRLSFQLTRGATPVLKVDAAHHRLVVLPLGHEVSHPLAALQAPRGWQLPGVKATPTPKPSAEPARTHLRGPYMADGPRRLVLPFSGEVPNVVAVTYQRNPRWITMDVQGADARLPAGKMGALNDALYEGWMLTKRPEPNHLRLYLRLRRAVPVTARLGPNGHEIWILPAAPASPTPRPMPTPTPEAIPSELPSLEPPASPAESALPVLLPRPE